MTIHRTKSGLIELLGQWGHGKAAPANYANRPATLISDDGDGHFCAWAVTGDMRDAAEVAARFDLRNDGRRVAVLEGNCVSMVNTPDDFWTETESGDFVENLAAYPDVVAY